MEENLPTTPHPPGPGSAGGAGPVGDAVVRVTSPPSPPLTQFLPSPTPQKRSIRTSTSIFSRLNLAPTAFQSKWRTRVRQRMDGVPLTLCWCAFTCTILYSDLIRTALLPPAVDPYFVGFTIVSMLVLAIEIVLSSLVRPGYMWRFYMWMDLVASFSLLCDIPAFVDFVTQPVSSDDDERHLTLERIAKAAQAGARAARIMQVVSVLQLLHLRAQRARLKKRERRLSGGSGASGGEGSTAPFNDERESGTDGADASNLQFQMTTLKPQTRVGEKLTEMTMRKVILGVLILLSMLPVFDSWVFYGTPTSFEDGGLRTLHALYGVRVQDGNSSSAFWEAVEAYREQNEYKVGGRTSGKLIRLVVHNETILDNAERFDYLRKSEKQSSKIKTEIDVNAFFVDGGGSGGQGQGEGGFATLPPANPINSTNTTTKVTIITESWTDVRWDVQFQSMLDIARVTCLLGMLSIGAVLFIRDADSLVLRPIERMVHKVKIMSENPFASKTFNNGDDDERDQAKQLETKVLERSIGKVCQLLTVGFGEAGAEIIANNIKSGGAINPMLPGKRMRAIFGFCDIRDFTSATEILQEDIMEFVNCIASVVHEEVSFHGGAANKNIGDAFLLVWRLPDTTADTKDPKTPGKTCTRRRGSIIEAKAAMQDVDVGAAGVITESHLADAALASMLIIKNALERSPKLCAFCEREDIQRRMPGFRVRLGMGLHVGWAIEGAIGSHHKIDPSYLSPHVNMAARLEAATKQYGVPILLSNTFVDILSPEVRQRCLAIDTVLVKGSNVPTTLFTVKIHSRDGHRGGSDGDRGDGADGADGVSATAAATTTTAATSATQDLRHATECAGGHISFSDYPYLNELDEHPDLKSTPWMDDDESMRMVASFEEAYTLYRAGDFKRATATLLARVDPTYGPAAALLEYMQSDPSATGGSRDDAGGWVRELTEK